MFVFVMYKEDSFNTVSPSELGLFWDSLKREKFFVASKYSGIWDSTILNLSSFNERPRFPRFTDKC